MILAASPFAEKFKKGQVCLKPVTLQCRLTELSNQLGACQLWVRIITMDDEKLKVNLWNDHFILRTVKKTGSDSD